MTDQLMDARLRAAGEAWRASTEAALEALASAEPVDVVAAHPRRPRRLAWLASAAVVAAALVAGGVYALHSGRSSTSGAAASTLTGMWRLTNLHDGSTNLPAAYPVTMRFDGGGEVTLVAECDQATMPVKVGRRLVTFGEPISTIAHGCVPVTAEYNRESAVIGSVVGGTARWSTDGGWLRLRKDGTTLTFGPITLAGPTWRLRGDQGLVVTLGGDGDVVVSSGGCADSTGRADIDGSTIRFSGLHFDASLCPYNRRVPIARSSDLARVRTFLDGNVHWSISGGQLTLTKDGTTLTFTR